MKKCTPIVALLACVSLLPGRHLERSCGTYRDNWREELQLHRRSQAAQRTLKLASGGKQAIKVLPDLGNIAHLEDADGVVVRRNPFNLNGKTIRFVLSASSQSYRVETVPGSYDEAAASTGALLADMGDDDTRELSLPFAFPFFGSEYRTIHVNSDGNLSFGKGDAENTDRSLGRLLSGPARIAAQFNDLDPTHARSGLKVQNEANRVVISWDRVPEYEDNGNGPLQTFQIRLFRNGTIELAYASGTPTEAVTGISPGGLKGEPSLVTFSGGTSADHVSAVAERFSTSEAIDIFAAAQKFYRNHADAYDYLAIYNTMNIDSYAGSVATAVAVRSEGTGYGQPPSQLGEEAGSKKRLRSILNMGGLNQYPRDPNGTVPARLTVGDTPLSTLAHEMGHLFLAYVSVDGTAGEMPMLGYQGAHWDFKFNSEASLLEGNRIQDNGQGASPRFLTTGTVEGYSALDQYLMGLRAPEEVPDTFYVTNTRGATTSGLPRKGVAFDGNRVNVSLREVIGTAGRRTPDHTVSQRRFRLAVLLVTPQGQVPTADQLAQVEGYRAGLEAFFEKATGQKATVDTTLRKGISVSAFPAFGVLAGGSVPVTVTLEEPAVSALTLQVRSISGRLRTPSTISIPQGESEAKFDVFGLAEGTDDLVVEPASNQYDSITSKAQVARASSLKLKVLSDASPLRVKATDVNELPYPAVTIDAQASGGGSLDRAASVTAADGVAEFQWTQSVQNQNAVLASIPDGPSVTISSSAAPSFAADSVLNAASYTAGLVPGGIATLFGANLGGQNARVTLNGSSVAILFANASQVNFVAPIDLQEGAVDVVVRSGNAISSSTRVSARPVQPGIFFNTATNDGAVVRAGSSVLTVDDPPAAGQYISIYATGLGAVLLAPSGLEETVLQPEVWVGGVRTEVTYSGRAPGYQGLYQINAKVPADAQSGMTSVVVSMSGVRSNEVRIRVR